MSTYTRLRLTAQPGVTAILLLLTTTLVLVAARTGNGATQGSDFVETGLRGYMTTPQELATVSSKAAQDNEPYRSAVESVIAVAGAARAWPYGSLDGGQTCSEPYDPPFLGRGSPLVYAKALAYHLKGEPAYAADVRKRLLDLTDTVWTGHGELSAANQCVLNLAWYIPAWIWAADLIEGSPDWRPEDKRKFQRWLGAQVYPLTAWASRERRGNWGAAGSAASGTIADYLWDSKVPLAAGADSGDGPGPTTQTPGEAYWEHRRLQLERMGERWRADAQCSRRGIQWHGGIPDELRRGSSGCDAAWLGDKDASWIYTQIHLEGLVAHAELLLRRGDKAIYELGRENGMGTPLLLRAIHFVLANPVRPERSHPWGDGHKPTLEITYRYYRDPPTAVQLGIHAPKRFIGGPSPQLLHFGTISHGFGSSEQAGLPPIVPAPVQ